MDIFKILILNARPAAGKSEIIDYLKRTPEAERRRRFHLGRLVEIDDFPMLWTWFEEDGILESMGLPRLHTDGQGFFRRRELWDLLIRRMCLDYRKALAEKPDLHGEATVLLEFSRGTEHGGYRAAYAALEPVVASQAAILYVDVSYEESVRKNRARFDPTRPHSILAHGLPEDKMERLYREIDWPAVTGGDPGHVPVGATRVPYVVMPNEDDVTTGRGEALGRRLETALGDLWRRGAPPG